MPVIPIAHLVVPTGTSAATVVAREPSADPAIEARRFARLVALEPISFRAQIEELIVQGVYTVVHGRVLVLRVIGGGTRTFAIVAAVSDPSGSRMTPTPRSGLFITPSIIELPADRARESGLTAIVEAEARQRPLFHGVTADGTTYSGFVVQQSAATLELLAQIASAESPQTPLAVLVLGNRVEVPPGLLVAMEPATE